MNRPVRICFVTLFAALAACGGGGGSDDPVVEEPRLEVKAGADQLKLRQFQSCDAYRAFVSEAIVNDLVAPFPYDWLLALPPGILGPVAPTDSSVPDMVSTTNLIEAGVDEADLVKTDSEGNLFVTSGRYLVVADGFPPTSMDTVTEFELSDTGTARRLFIDRASGRAMVVIDGTPDPLAEADPVSPVYYQPGTTLVFIDIDDIANPAITSRLWLENSRDERLIDGRVHLLNQQHVSHPDEVYTDTALQALRTSYYEALANNDETAIEVLRAEILLLVSDIVAATPIDDFLPRARIAGADGQFSQLNIASCANIISPSLSVRLGLTTVLSLDLDGTDIGALTALTTAFGIPYVSAQNYYLQQTSNNWWLNTDQAEQTAIHKITIGTGAPEYRGMGLIDGVAQNPFQFSEYEGYLRVFTNEQRLFSSGLWFPFQTNHLFVLEDDGAGTLAVAGSVLNVAEDESIFAARFLGDRGFLVTFLQIDPLFAFDLHDPYAPTLTGELEIPGFSNYIHPLGDNHLLTIGRSGAGQPGGNQVQLQIFDVTDMTQPMLIHSYTPVFDGQEDNWSWSPAEYEHKAFTYFAASKILTIPYSQSGRDPESQFDGFLVLRIDVQTGFEELGRIDHDDLAYEAYCQPYIDTGTTPPEYCTNPAYRLGATPTRSVIMTEDETAYIYSLSNVGIKATPALDANDVLGSILFPVSSPEYWVVN